jgi:hypothetical protein
MIERLKPRGKVRIAWFQRLCSVGGLVVLFIGQAGLPALSEGLATTFYQPAAGAPDAWRDFAARLQGRLQEMLAADEYAQLYRDYLGRRGAASQPLPALMVRTWVLGDGRLRVAFDDIDDRGVEMRLRALLERGHFGSPPPDMPQPLHLRLTLRPDQPHGN